MRLALLSLVLFVGCVPAACIKQAKTEVLVNRGHADDPTLPPQARLIALDAVDAWSTQLYGLTGKDLPKDVEARMRERKTLPEGYGE